MLRIPNILFLLFALAFLNGYSKDKVNIDSLHQVLSLNIQDTSRVNTMAHLAEALLQTKKVADAKRIAIDAFELAKEKDLETPYYLNWTMAEIYLEQRDPSPGLEQMNMVVKKLLVLGDNQKLAEAQNLIGYLYLWSGKFSECIETYTKNIEFAKTNRLNDIIPGAYSGLSYVYMNLEKTEEQRKNLILMADVAVRDSNYKSAANAYLRLGDIGMNSDSNFTYAIQHYKHSLKYRTLQNDTSAMAFLLLRIGWNHYLNQELDTALNYFFNSLEYSIPENRLTSITNAYGNIGTIYRDQKDFSKASKYYRKSIEYSLKAKDWYNLSWLYKDMSDMYKSQDKYKLAYQNLVLHKQYSDSIELSRYNDGLAKARGRFQAESDQKELELLALKLNQQKYFTYGFAGLMVLVVVIGFLIFRSHRLNAKQKINKMNHRISEVTQKNLRQQMNPHFIFNTLNSIQYYMYQHDKISTNNYLTKFSLLMRKTLENSQHTSIPIKDEMDALELYLELEALRFKEKFNYSMEVDEDIDTHLLKIPTMLIQPYVENAISHGLIHKEGVGNVNVTMKLKGEFLETTIEDNGIGRDAAMEIKNSRNGNHNSLGTKITESRLNLVNSLYGNNMRIDYTDMKNNDGKPAGTKVVINIPIMT